MTETLVILHGWRGSKKSFESLLEILDERIKPLVFDLPGFGEKPLTKPYDLESYVKFVEETIDQNLKSEEKFYLLGHSFGGALGVLYALKHPEKLKALILLNPALIREKGLKTRLILILTKFLKPFEKILPNFLKNFLKKLFYRFIVGSYDYLLVDENLKQTFKNIQKDLSSEVKNLKVKTYLIWGKNDKITPLKHGLKLKSLIPEAELIILDGEHNIHKENPEILGQILKKIIFKE